GPAPWADYSPQRVDWMGWRMIRDYSGGILTDWGAHIVDTAQVGASAEKSGPVEIKGSGAIPDGVMNTAKQTFDLHYTFANGVTMHVVSKGVRLKFIGSEGWCGNRGWRGGIEAHDRRIFKQTYTESNIWPQPPGEHRDFLNSVKSRKDPAYPAEDIHRLSTTLHLGAIAMELGRTLKWDPDKEYFVGDEQADTLRSRTARDWAKA
ncbi:MAG: gfo/Idh/MocA family oxidoreductase, partial [Verrucomicrobiota bacterium]